jgi:hypothetical protein
MTLRRRVVCSNIPTRMLVSVTRFGPLPGPFVLDLSLFMVPSDTCSRADTITPESLKALLSG